MNRTWMLGVLCVLLLSALGCESLKNMEIVYDDKTADEIRAEREKRKAENPDLYGSKVTVCYFDAGGGGGSLKLEDVKKMNAELKQALKNHPRIELVSHKKIDKIPDNLLNRYDRMSPEWVQEVHTKLGFENPQVYLDPRIVVIKDIGKHAPTGKVMQYNKLTFTVRTARWGGDAGWVTDLVEEYGHEIARDSVTKRVIDKTQKATFGHEIKTQVEEEAEAPGSE